MRFVTTFLRCMIHAARGVVAKLPITPLGTMVASLLAWTLLWLGIDRHDRVILAIAAFGLAWICVAVLLVACAATWFAMRRQTAPDAPISGETEQTIRTGFCIGRFPWTLLLRCESHWESVGDVAAQLDLAGGRWQEAIRPGRRMRVQNVVRSIRVTDPLGLAAITLRFRTEQPITVLPHRCTLSAAPTPWRYEQGDMIAHHLGERDGDLLDIRRYAHGDPLKQIMWKSYARTGQVMVRTPERSVSPTSLLLAYFVAGNGDEPTAGVARAMLEDLPPEQPFLFGADGTDEPADDRPSALDHLIDSVGASDPDATALQRFLDQQITVQGQCLLFVPSKLGNWLEPTASAIAMTAWGCEVIMGVDDWSRGPGRWQRLFCRRPGRSSLTALRDVGEIAQRLTAAGASVVVVDRRSGEVVDLDAANSSTQATVAA